MTGEKGLGDLETSLADPDDRREKEVAVLATLAKEGPTSDVFQAFLIAYGREDLNFRPELADLAIAVFDLGVNGLPADRVLVMDKLKGKRISEDDVKAILDPAEARPQEVAREYIDALVKLERQRKQDAELRRIAAGMTKALEAKGPAVAHDVALRGLLDMADDPKRGGFKRLRTEAEIMPDFLDDLDSRRNDGREFSGLVSGFNHLDQVFNGLQGLVVIGAQTSCGKTTFAKQIADQVAEREKIPVLFFTYEQSAEDLRVKSLARLSSVDTRAIFKGKTKDNSQEWENVKVAAKKYAEGPGQWLKIIEADATIDPEKIRQQVMIEKHKTRADRVLVIIDYLQLVPAGIDLPSVKDRVDLVLSELRRISRDLGATVIAISSLNRASTKDETKAPTLDAMKESGGIEYSADAVIALWWNKSKDPGFKVTARRIEAHVRKNRNGELATIFFDFTPSWARFDEKDKAKADEVF